MSLGFTEILLIIVVILLLFGGKRIPELAKALGRAKFEYDKAKNVLKNEAKELSEVVEKAVDQEQKTQEICDIATNTVENKNDAN